MEICFTGHLVPSTLINSAVISGVCRKDEVNVWNWRLTLVALAVWRREVLVNFRQTRLSRGGIGRFLIGEKLKKRSSFRMNLFSRNNDTIASFTTIAQLLIRIASDMKNKQGSAGKWQDLATDTTLLLAQQHGKNA